MQILVLSVQRIQHFYKERINIKIDLKNVCRKNKTHTVLRLSGRITSSFALDPGRTWSFREEVLDLRGRTPVRRHCSGRALQFGGLPTYVGHPFETEIPTVKCTLNSVFRLDQHSDTQFFTGVFKWFMVNRFIIINIK